MAGFYYEVRIISIRTFIRTSLIVHHEKTFVASCTKSWTAANLATVWAFSTNGCEILEISFNGKAPKRHHAEFSKVGCFITRETVTSLSTSVAIVRTG